MMKPCIECGTPANGTRCPQHAEPERRRAAQQHQQRRNQRGGPRTRGGAGLGPPPPHAVCWICHQPATPNDPMQWDHLIPIANGGAQGGPRGTAHRSCNIRRSNSERAQARARAARHARTQRLTRNNHAKHD